MAMVEENSRSLRDIGMGAAVPHFAVSRSRFIPISGLERLTANEFSRDSFQVYLLHSWRFGANEVARSVIPSKTGALERVLRATGRYSMRRWGSDAPSTLTSRSEAHLSLVKVPEGKDGEAVVKMSRERVYLD